MKHNSRHASLPALFGAAALALTLAVTGCGSTEATDEQPVTAEEPEEAPEVSTGEVSVPEMISQSAASSKSIVANNDTEGSEAINELPTRDANGIELEATELAEGTEDSSKVSSDHMMLAEGGLQMAIPSDWMVSRDEDGFVFSDPEGGLLGFMFSAERNGDETYNYQGLVSAIPQHELNLGYTAVEIIDHGPLYTTDGADCGYSIFFWESFDGGEYLHYVALIESRSYLNTIEFMGSPEAFEVQLDNISNALDSIAFVQGEAI